MEDIEILFKEYDTLQAEIRTRTNNGYQLFGLGTGTVAWIFSRQPTWMLFVSTGVLAGVFLFAFLALGRDMNRIATRLREIESEVNSDFRQEVVEVRGGVRRRCAWMVCPGRRGLKGTV